MLMQFADVNFDEKCYRRVDNVSYVSYLQKKKSLLYCKHVGVISILGKGKYIIRR